MWPADDLDGTRTLRIILEAAPVGIGLVRNRILGWCNDRVEEILGYAPSELAGQSALILYPDQAEFERVGREKHPAIEAGGVGTVEARMVRKDGQQIDVLLSSAALERGNLDAGLIFTLLDITDQRETEARLRERERALATLLANLPGMAYRCRNDANWTMEFLSEACPRLTGRPVSAFLENAELAFADIIHPEDRDRIWQRIQAALLDRESFELEYRIATPGGEKWVWERGRGVFGADESLEALEGFITDITDRKRLEQRALESQRLEAVGQLAGGVAHDFNNLLQVINGYAAMLADDLRHGRGEPDHVAEIRRAGERAGVLVRQLLAFSRRQVLHRTALDLNLTVARLLPMLTSMLGSTIELAFHDDPHLGRVDADAGQLEQVLVNLCLNAREAMREGGRVEITTADVVLQRQDCAHLPGTRPGRHARLEVADTGRGMAPDVAAQALEPFFTTKAVGEGSGLGLATVYGIVQQHGGGLSLQSGAGQGTRVAVYLPVIGAETAAGAADGPAGEGEPAEHPTILVAEDDPGVLQLTRQLLEKDGYRVLAARDGKEALAVFASHRDRVALAVLDVVMPGHGGRAVHDVIRRETPALPIVFCTGYDLPTLHPDLELDQATAVLQKPFTPGDLLAGVRKLLAAGRRG